MAIGVFQDRILARDAVLRLFAPPGMQAFVGLQLMGLVVKNDTTLVAADLASMERWSKTSCIMASA